MAKTHELKIWPYYYHQVKNGNKTFEYRKNDRNFKMGDELWLLEWDAGAERYTGRSDVFKIGYILYGPEFGIPEGYCVMSLLPAGPTIR